MAGFLREHSWPIVASVLLHGLLAVALLSTALISFRHAPPTAQPLPIDAVVVDAQSLHAAQHTQNERVEQDAARAREAADAAAAAAAQTAADQKRAADQAEAEAQNKAQLEAAAEASKAAAAAAAVAEEQRTADAQALAAKQAEERKLAEEEAQRAEEAKRAEEEAQRAAEAKQAEEAKRAAEAKQAEDAKHAAEQKAKSEREAELRRQLADEEHVSAVQASPLRDQYLARLQSRIQSAWIRPPSARVGLDCVVNITQIPGGEVTSAHVSQCNGDTAARQSIENAVIRASPLPPPPDPALFDRNLVIHFHPDQ